MNPELQKELAAWLASMRDSVQQGAGFAIEQAPLVVQEKIAYGRISETIGLLIAAVLLVASLWILRRAPKWYEDDDNPGGYILGGVGTVCGVVFFFIQLDGLAKVWFAPRLYVLEWLAGLLKS